MKGGWGLRAVAAAASAAVGLALALLAGAPPVGAVVALLGGALAFVFLAWGLGTEPAPATVAMDDEPSEIPGMADLLRAVEEPMLIVRDRRVIAANDPARELLGAHIEGVDVRLAIRHPAAAEKLTGPASQVDARTRIDLIGVGDPNRQWAMAITVLHDDSRLVRLIDQSAARAAEQMRVDFVANASHELRTPLATILGFLETLEDDEAGGDRDTRRRFVKIMFDEATRMKNLVEDLMSLSRIEAERFAVPRDPVDLLPLIEEVKAALAQLIAAKHASLVVEKESQSSVVQGDRSQLAQLLNNLIANAIKYGRAAAPVRVRIAESAGEMLRVEVIDEGEGIAPEHLPRLTERFYRIDAGRSRAVGGTGLGLAIVKHIVLRHRGRIEIDSVVGQGTTVRLDLPRAASSSLQ